MHLDATPGMNGAEPIHGELGLGQRERTAATAEPERPVGKRWGEGHMFPTGDGDDFRPASSKPETRGWGRFGEVTGICNLRKSC